MGPESQLIAASRSGNTEELVRILNDFPQIAVDACDDSGFTALHRAAARGDSETIKILVQAGSNVNIQAAGGETPLHMAVANAYYQATVTLLESHADASLKTTGGHTPLHFACRDNSRGDLVEALLQKCSNIDEVAKDGTTALHIAASTHNLETVAVLLRYKPNITLRDKNSRSAIQIASMHGGGSNIAMLIATALSRPLQ